MTIGLISDTHGYFDPRLPALFAGVDHILHAGDIGGQRIVDELTAIAPVTAVLGNNDFDPNYCETEVVELEGHRFFVHHIVDRRRVETVLLERIARAMAQTVIFGHTHKRCLDRDDGLLWVNPGYAGKPRFNQPRSVARLQLGAGGPDVQFLPLD